MEIAGFFHHEGTKTQRNTKEIMMKPFVKLRALVSSWHPWCDMSLEISQPAKRCENPLIIYLKTIINMTESTFKTQIFLHLSVV